MSMQALLAILNLGFRPPATCLSNSLQCSRRTRSETGSACLQNNAKHTTHAVSCQPSATFAAVGHMVYTASRVGPTPAHVQQVYMSQQYRSLHLDKSLSIASLGGARTAASSASSDDLLCRARQAICIREGCIAVVNRSGRAALLQHADPKHTCNVLCCLHDAQIVQSLTAAFSAATATRRRLLRSALS